MAALLGFLVFGALVVAEERAVLENEWQGAALAHATLAWPQREFVALHPRSSGL